MFCPNCGSSISPQDRQCPVCMHPLTSSPSPPSSPSDNASIPPIKLPKGGLASANFLEGVVVERLNHQPEKYHIGCMERIARIIISVELILITLFIIIPLAIYLSTNILAILITCIVLLYLFVPLPKHKLKGFGLFTTFFKLLNNIFKFPLNLVWNLLRSLLHSRSMVEVWEYRISPTDNSAHFDGFFVIGKLAPRTLSRGDVMRVWVKKRHGRLIFRRGEVLINGRRLPLHVVEDRRAVIRWTFSAVVFTAFFIWIFYITYLSSSLQNYGGAT